MKGSLNDLSNSESLNSDETDLLQISNENISFTPTVPVSIIPVSISVRDLSIGSSTGNRSFKGFKIPFFKKKETIDIERNDKVNTILHTMSFDIPSSSLTCIIGGSGSGKTTLLNCLANRKFNKNTIFKEGEIKYNNDSSLSNFRHAYVIQQDILLPTLTCFETLMYAAELKLPKLTSREKRINLVNEIILTLGLNECKNTLVGDQRNKGLSGGERRRLSVGLQLVSNPSVLFLDEPTTGLDNYNAYLLVKSFQHLAKRLNKTIIMSIHQPRADIFKLFDTVLILSKGRLCYGSSYLEIFSHFSSLGYTIPEKKVNPGDYFIDITSVDTRNRTLEIESLERVQRIAEEWSHVMQNLPPIQVSHSAPECCIDENIIFQDVGRAPFIRELNILIRRNFLLQKRDPIGWFSILFEAMFLGLLSGWLFFKPGDSPAGVRSLEGSLYTSCSLFAYLFLLYETYRLCTNDLKMFDRERMDNCVSVPGFLIARRITKFVTEDFWIAVLLSVTTYFMYGLRTDSPKYFFKYFAGCLIFVLNSMAFATFSASISRDVAIATLVSNLNFTFQSMTNGLYANDPNVSTICYQSSGEFIIKDLGFWQHWNALPICVVLAFFIGHYIAAGFVLYLLPLDMSMGKEIKTNAIDNSLDYEKQINEMKSEDTKEATQNDANSNFISVTIENINLSVKNKLNRTEKVILNNVSAKFRAGKINAIMGPSGSGKTSLLNYISGRLASNFFTKYTSSGMIFLNNYHIKDYQMIRPVCSYVVQEDDHLLSAITVRETLRYAARLRLSKSNLSDEQKNIIVDDIILKMGLKDSANTLVGNELIKGISGGEKRRLSIAIQLISSPKILFLDEPTSGLDSFTAASIIECLEKLANQGTTIIMTIHQPRSIDRFGSILLLAKGGRVAFDGPESSLIPYFAELGYPIPKFTNVADFIIDLISYNTSSPEIEADTKARVNFILNSWESTSRNLQQDDTKILNSKKEVQETFKSVIKKRASFKVGFEVMVSRQWLGLVRDKNIVVARSSQVTGMGIILALFFSRLKHNTTSIQNRLGLIQQFTALYFTGMLNNLSSYPQERDFFYEEYNDDVVDLNSFFFSYLFIEIPFEIVTCFIFTIFVVFVVGLQTDAALFFTIFYATFLIVNAGESLGISLNTVFDHPGFALNVISVFCSIGVAMSGLLAMTLDGFLKAINYTSPLHYCVMLIANRVFTESLQFTCTSSERLPNGNCPYINGADFANCDHEIEVDTFSVSIEDHNLPEVSTEKSIRDDKATRKSYYNTEHLDIKPLLGNNLLLSFNFALSDQTELYNDNKTSIVHYDVFPKSLGTILKSTSTRDLHLRFGHGWYDSELNGKLIDDGFSSGGTGVELWADIEANNKTEAFEKWIQLANSLSGLFCASLNFIDSSVTTSPAKIFSNPVDLESQVQLKGNLYHFRSALPREPVCTENLTPFLKLLPTKGKQGISTLLSGNKLFNAEWSSMSIDIITECSTGDVNHCTHTMKQSINMIINVPKILDKNANPIPSPTPGAELRCDQEKISDAYHCFPLPPSNSLEFSFMDLFAKPIGGGSLIASSPTTVCLDLDLNNWEVQVLTSSQISERFQDSKICFDLKSDADYDFKFKTNDARKINPVIPPPFFASRSLSGYSQANGGFRLDLHNPTDDVQKVIIFETLPWFVRLYLHSLVLTVTNKETGEVDIINVQDERLSNYITEMIYNPEVDRKTPTHFELMVVVPMKTKIKFSFDFDKAMLLYAEYPPDANHGFELEPAVFALVDPEHETKLKYVMPSIFHKQSSEQWTIDSDSSYADEKRSLTENDSETVELYERRNEEKRKEAREVVSSVFGFTRSKILEANQSVEGRSLTGIDELLNTSNLPAARNSFFRDVCDRVFKRGEALDTLSTNSTRYVGEASNHLDDEREELDVESIVIIKKPESQSSSAKHSNPFDESFQIVESDTSLGSQEIISFISEENLESLRLDTAEKFKTLCIDGSIRTWENTGVFPRVDSSLK
ncbi:hypothetical protein CANINC_000734 [Pichia inconspicua]|uniref:ABC transporter domain-containing protein n=1 Tax=Pichia inconspicua TaxID=52247 RepID=A0A4T0X6H7_9ASCO|nr:hypothetical protein CANINC_000734 [[Candida] inconspicua]